MLETPSIELPIGFEPSEAKEISTKTKKRGEPIEVRSEVVSIQYADLFRIADDARSPREQVWRECWNLYNGEYNWAGKEDWQAKINIPKVRNVVDKATASFRRALIRMKRFYHIESETRLGIEKGFFTMSLIDYWLDQLNFIEEFSTGLKSGLITSTIVFKTFPRWITETQPRFEDRMVKEPITELGIKVGELLRPVQMLVDDPRTRWSLGFQAVDPFNMWIGPRNRYRIEKTTRDLSELEELARQGVYSREAVDQLRERTGQGYAAWDEAKRRGENPDTFKSKYSRPVDLYHFWGDLYNEDGGILAHDVAYTMAGSGSGSGSSNGATADIVLSKPISNPFFHGRDPYVVGTPYIVPFSTYNRGIVEDVIGIVKMITELSNLIIDGAQFDAMQAYEIDDDLLADPRQAKRGIFPGATFVTKAYENPGQKNVVRSITTGKVPQLALNILGYLDKEQQLSTNVTNAMQGSSIGAETLGEFQSLTAMAGDSLDDAARTVEETTLDETLFKIAGLIFQYHDDYTLDRLLENFPVTTNMLAEMSPAERYAMMMGGFAFKARGVSIFMDKNQDLKQIETLLQLIGNIPGVIQRINIDELLNNIFVGIGWNPSKLLMNDQFSAVYPAGMQAGMPADPMMQQQGQLTPVQMLAAQQGAQMGGARNNPMANAGMPLGADPTRSAQ